MHHLIKHVWTNLNLSLLIYKKMLPSSATSMSGSGAFTSSSPFLAPLKNDLFDTKKVSIQSLNFVFVLRS